MKRLTALILLTILLVSCTESEKRIKLSFKYKPGMQLEYRQDSKRQTQIYNTDTLVKDEFDESYAFIKQNIAEIVNDSTFKIDEIDTWHYTMPNKDDSTQMDSVTYSREMTLTVLQNGKIIDFNFKDTKENISEYMKSYYEQGLPIFPSVEVSPGYSWTQTTSVVLPNETMNASTTYSIKSFVRESGYDCAVIEYTGNLLIPIEPKKDDKTQRSGIDKIQTNGMIYFAYIEGIVIKQTEIWKTEGERTHIEDGDWKRQKFISNYDVNFILIDSKGLR